MQQLEQCHYGKKDDDGNYLTIKDINNGLDYVQDDVAVALFGVIEKTVMFEDVTVAENLFKKGQETLQESINSIVSIELSAADLHNLDVNIEAFRIGDNVRVISKTHGLDRYFLLSKLSLTLDSVSSCSMTLGATFKTFTQKQIEAEKMLSANVQKNTENVEILNKNVVTIENNVEKLDEDIAKIDKDVQEINKNLIQVPDNYVKVTDFVAYKKEVNQKLYGIYTVKGSVADFETLQTIENKEIGDVYNLLDTGANYVYTANGWDKLSETIDLSIYLKEEDAKLLYVSLETYQALVTRVETLENKNNESAETEKDEGGEIQ